MLHRSVLSNLEHSIHHCYDHALKLAAADTIKQNKLLCDALDITSEISILLKYYVNPFEMLKQPLAPDVMGFRTLYPTRWMVNTSSLDSVLKNCRVFQALWEEARELQIQKHTAGVQFKISMPSEF